MRLYVLDRAINQKVYLNLNASTRGELARLIQSPWFTLNGRNFHVNQVVAETQATDTAVGAVIGGLIGLVGGPAGAIAGGLLGGILGNTGDKTEIQRVNYFNKAGTNVKEYRLEIWHTDVDTDPGSGIFICV